MYDCLVQTEVWPVCFGQNRLLVVLAVISSLVIAALIIKHIDITVCSASNISKDGSLLFQCFENAPASSSFCFLFPQIDMYHKIWQKYQALDHCPTTLGITNSAYRAIYAKWTLWTEHSPALYEVTHFCMYVWGHTHQLIVGHFI